MKKIVVLNSGGFDSIVLVHHLNYTQSDSDIHSLHFSYGEPNMQQQSRCVSKVCEKFGLHNVILNLPKFEWTNSKFYEEDYSYETQYLEYRNLIFLSYAASYAESIGAKEIYLATCKGEYNDVNDDFFNGLNEALKSSGISIIRPFKDVESKEELLPLAFKYKITNEEYFSCDVPKNGNPCGECDDCKGISHIAPVLEVDTPDKALFYSEFNYEDKRFLETIHNTKIKELRVLTNNECQLKCDHCFYGFEKMTSEKLSIERMADVIREADSLGVENIHFSGKEPLYDDTVILLARNIRDENLKCTFDLVTNGINLPKYIEELKDLDVRKIYLSVDDVLMDKDMGIRHTVNVTYKALDCCEKNGVDVEVFIDLHEGNYWLVDAIINYLLESYTCVKSFFIRTIRSLGRAGNKNFILPLAKLDTAFLQVMGCAEEHEDILFNFSIGIEYENTIFGRVNSSLKEYLSLPVAYDSGYIRNNLMLHMESHCNRYGGTVTITPDGYILGCASEVSSKDYAKLSVGNVREHSLESLISMGKDKAGEYNSHYRCGECKKCSFLY